MTARRVIRIDTKRVKGKDEERRKFDAVVAGWDHVPRRTTDGQPIPPGYAVDHYRLSRWRRCRAPAEPCHLTFDLQPAWASRPEMFPGGVRDSAQLIPTARSRPNVSIAPCRPDRWVPPEELSAFAVPALLRRAWAGLTRFVPEAAGCARLSEAPARKSLNGADVTRLPPNLPSVLFRCCTRPTPVRVPG